MTPEEFWQNYKLGEEKEIASSFIYDGLKNLHELNTLNNEIELLPIFYNLSIGIERLFKVIIILLEFNLNTEISKFEKSLLTHNHIQLIERIRKNTDFVLTKSQNAFLSLLSDFYKSRRYNRLSLISVLSEKKDKETLHVFLYKYLYNKESDRNVDSQIKNDISTKRFIGEVVKSITLKINDIINKEASRKNIFTYEMSSSQSKAAKVLTGDKYLDFIEDDINKLESLIFLLHTQKSLLMKCVKSIEPLKLDEDLDNYHLKHLFRDPYIHKHIDVEEIKYEQAELRNSKKRQEELTDLLDVFT